MFLPLQVRLTYDRPLTSLRQRRGAPCPPVTCPVLRDLALCLVVFLGLVASLPCVSSGGWAPNAGLVWALCILSYPVHVASCTSSTL